MLTVKEQDSIITPEAVEAIVARARRERDAEIGRLLAQGFAALRRMQQQALAALRSHGFGSRAHHA